MKPRHHLNHKQFLELLNRHIAEGGSVAAFAEKHEVSAPFVSMVIHGKRPPPDWICSLLGYKRVTTRTVKTAYERVAERS